MELSERYIAQLEKEGFTSVSEEQDAPGTVYPEHAHGKAAFYITDGSITFTVNGDTTELKAGDRLDIPANTTHSAVVGPEGAIYILGEM